MANENKFYWIQDLHVVIAQKSIKYEIGVAYRLTRIRL